MVISWLSLWCVWLVPFAHADNGEARDVPPVDFDTLGLQDYPPNDGPQVSFARHKVTIDYTGEVSVPVGIWWRADTNWHLNSALANIAVRNEPTYPYRIDVGRIATNFKQGWLSWAPSRRFQLPRGSSTLLPGPHRKLEAIVFAHGFLGSPYDMAHVCERLAADGCASPPTTTNPPFLIS